MRERILIDHRYAPGDTVCLTSAVRDLVCEYPDRYEVHVTGSCSDLWRHNPWIAKYWVRPSRWTGRRIVVDYRQELRQVDQRRRHIVTAYHQALATHLDHPIPVRLPKGDLHLTAAERSTTLVDGRYWLVVGGGKLETATMLWAPGNYQQLTDRLTAEGIPLVQIGATFSGHWHPPLRGVRNLVGQTSLREVLRLVYHADGVICPVTFAMHAAAAFDKPCVVIAGGRESWWWGAYIADANPFAK